MMPALYSFYLGQSVKNINSVKNLKYVCLVIINLFILFIMVIRILSFHAVKPIFLISLYVHIRIFCSFCLKNNPL